MPLTPKMRASVDTMQADLGALPGLSEQRMFGGIAFLLHGHMLCGVHPRAAMYRVGKTAEPQALDLPGVRPMAFTGRRMGGLVELDPQALQDSAVRSRLTDMALGFVATLPPKPGKSR